MSDSEDEFLFQKKQYQLLIDSDEDENDGRYSSNNDSNSHLPSQTTSRNSEDICNQSTDLLSNVQVFDQSFLAVHPNCTTNSKSNSASQSTNESQSCRSSQPNPSFESSQTSSVNTAKRKSCSSSSDNSDSESSRLTLINDRSHHRTTKRLSPNPDTFSLNCNTVLNDNKHLNSPKSSVISLASNYSSEPENETLDTGFNTTEGVNQSEIHEKFDDLSQSENIVKSKVKKYKLLSDDDLSEDDGSHSPMSSGNFTNKSDDTNRNSEPTESSKLKKEKRKKKLQLLNKLKKKEVMEKSGNSTYDSECETHEIVNVSRETNSNCSRPFSDNSAASDSENDKVKASKKSKQKSLPQRKSKKSDPMLEIKSKTQKMIRENRISLPYHQPKKRSLDEFLERRKNTPSIPLKATSEFLNVVSEHLLKREKEVEIFYKSESDHSDNDVENDVIIISQTVSNKISELENNAEAVKEDSVIPENSYVAAKKCNDLITKCEMDVEIQQIPSDANNTPTNVNCSDQDPPSSSAELADGSLYCFSLNKFTEKLDEEYFDNLPNIEACKTQFEGAVSGIPNTVQEGTKLTDDRSELLQHKNRSTENAETIEENRETSTVTNVTMAEKSPEPNSAECSKVLPKIVDQNSTEENTSEKGNASKESALVGPAKNPTEPPDTDDFDLMIQDSCDDTENSKNDSEIVTPKPLADLRSKKLALLSQLNIPLRTDIKLQASPDIVIELEAPFKSASEFGVFELKKKFAFHASIRNKPARKNSSKLSIIRTETDSQGDVINVVKETIDVSLGEVKEDEEEDKFSIPGAKHLNFKEHMLKSLIEKKQAKWQEYQNEKRKLVETLSSDGDDNFDEEDNPKPDFEPYHPEDELDDEELEENDVEIKEKKKRKNDYVDDEAEVSYDEDENMKESDAEDEESDKEVEDEAAEEEADDGVNSEDEAEDEDSDSENTKKEEMIGSSQPSITATETFKKPLSSQVCPLFKYNTTGVDLENKVLGFESIFEQKSQISSEVTSSQLFEICSGKFATQAEKLNTSDPSDMEFFSDSQHAEDSQNINLSLQDTNDGFNASVTQISEDRNALFLSDESDTEELFARKKRLVRLQDSDEETDVVAIEDDEFYKGENDTDKDELNNNEDVDEVDALNEDEEELAYNSEEEIVTKEKAAEFFENEAELSESEWGSEDENEQNLDELEKEAGDDDILDEDELKEELGKIHMRQILDDDQKDVRMLKEMLLEDGELHSDGQRQRKFQWTNLDDNGFFSKLNDHSDEEVLNEEDEEESDANWRKIRHEREMFISRQEKKEDLLEDEADDETSDELALPKATVNQVSVNNNKPNVTTNNNISSPDLKLPFKARFKCGSFLTRSKMLLGRLAVTVGECKENVTGKTKNHRNFVFATVSPEKELPNVPEMKTEKRKISSNSVMARKKLKSTPTTNQRGLLAQLALNE